MNSTKEAFQLFMSFLFLVNINNGMQYFRLLQMCYKIFNDIYASHGDHSSAIVIFNFCLLMYLFLSSTTIRSPHTG